MSDTNTARVQVAFVNAAKPGKKKGSIKTEDGRYFDVWSDKLDQFHKGAEYDIEFDTRNYNGKDYFGIQKFARVGGGTFSVANGNGASKPNVTQSAHSPSATGEDRSSRIERQHSQHMALRYFHIKGGLPDTTDKLRAMIDWFQRDVGHVPTAPARKQERAIEDFGASEGNGNEGDFQL